MLVSVKPISIEQRIASQNVLQAQDIGTAADFIRDCLRLDPAQRPTAAEAAVHPFLLGATFCANYREI